MCSPKPNATQIAVADGIREAILRLEGAPFCSESSTMVEGKINKKNEIRAVLRVASLRVSHVLQKVTCYRDQLIASNVRTSFFRPVRLPETRDLQRGTDGNHEKEENRNGAINDA
jgi:hypothetical protein